MKRFTQETWIPCAILLTAICAFLWGLNFSTPVSLELAKRIGSEWVSFFGSLLGAVATVLASVLVVTYQSNKANEAAEKQKQRELRAARALLASDLDILMEYISDCVKLLLRIRDLPEAVDARSLKPVPIDPLLRIARLISLEPPGNQKALPRLLEYLQIHNARLSIILNDYNTQLAYGSPSEVVLFDSSFDSTFSMATAIHMKISSLFPYARRKTEEIAEADFTDENFLAAVNALGLEKHYLGTALERIGPNTRRLIIFY